MASTHSLVGIFAVPDSIAKLIVVQKATTRGVDISFWALLIIIMLVIGMLGYGHVTTGVQPPSAEVRKWTNPLPPPCPDL